MRVPGLPTTLASGLALCLLASACSTTTKPLDIKDISNFSQERILRSTAGQEPITGTIDLYDAMARALKYNLDARVEIAEAALKIEDKALLGYDMLPQIVASSGYAGRSQPDSSTPSTRDADIVSADMTVSWTILDFGLSYIRAQQAGDEALIQEEMKRKIVNRVIEDTRTAYYRAASYQRLVGRMHALERRIGQAMRETRQLASGGETSPLAALTYERELIQIKREIELLEGEMIVAKGQLAALMNVDPGSDFKLAMPKYQAVTLGLPKDRQALYRLAAENRPEMREILYRMRISDKDVDAALLQLLPNFNLSAALSYDSNEFIAANDWISWGSKVSWNILKLASVPAMKTRNAAKAQALDMRALSVAMAIMTQVTVSSVRFRHLDKSYRTARALSDVSRRLVAQVRAETEAQTTSQQTLIREEMNALLADAKRDMAYADLQNAYANVYASLGLDPFPEGLSTRQSLPAISAALKAMWAGRADRKDVTVPVAVTAIPEGTVP